MEKIDRSLFEHVGKNLEEAQAIKRPSMSYLEDAMRRLKKNKPAMISFWVLLVLILMSLIGPIISAKVQGHDYRQQNLANQNQTSVMTNQRSVSVVKNQVFKYDTYKPNLRKTKTVFKGVQFKGTGTLEFKVGNKSEASYQGDKKEYSLAITVDSDDNWKSVVEKLNAESDKMLQQDSDFRGIKFKRSGSNLIVETKGDKWFNKQYWFGTDEFGRDLFTRLWKGGRTSFLIAFVAVIITVFIGIVYGGVAGYLGGTVDTLMMRFVEIIMVVPDLLYIILLLTVMKPGLGPIIIVLAATGWMQTAMIVRGEVLRLKNSEYVIAAEVLGADSKRIIFKHLIPNTMGPIIVNMTMMIPRMIFSEAFLSFIGLGIPAPMASWGSLVNAGASIFTQYPQQLLVPALALSLTMLAFNILGDGLRDALDPKLRT
ncbi:ABC transporter permease subunit [Clostridium bovifaecis]|uniref:ABC transporter permease subunit n=1 Tax=Clostridium bovifaecis TaxID=2184719 RepID=A0A6I6EXG8_9CLOT|nr:ABC transporter permease subunit [Clostridium bovifaecis]